MVTFYLIHGWGGYPDNCWFPWLEHELQKAGYEVIVPTMPDPDNPSINAWVRELGNIVQQDEERVFVGHSIGCQTILRFLEKSPTTAKAVFMVAGWISLTPGSVSGDDALIAEEWLTTPIAWATAKKKSKHYVAIFSDDDPFVPLSDATIFEKELGAKTITLSGRGHFDDESDTLKLPEIIEEIKKIL